MYGGKKVIKLSHEAPNSGYIGAYCSQMDLHFTLAGRGVQSRLRYGQPLKLETDHVEVHFVIDRDVKDGAVNGIAYDAVFDANGNAIGDGQPESALMYILLEELGAK